MLLSRGNIPTSSLRSSGDWKRLFSSFSPSRFESFSSLEITVQPLRYSSLMKIRDEEVVSFSVR